MRNFIVPLLLLLPLPAFAQSSQCKHSQPRNLQLDLSGVTTVVFDIANNEVDVVATPGGAAAVAGKACASDQKLLGALILTQQKAGDKLLVTARRESMSSGIFFSNDHAYMTLAATLPDSLTVQLKVSSGDASVTGARIASVDVGSGDAHVRHTRGLVAAKVGSGDIEIVDAGSLKVISVGSGNLKAKGIGGSVNVDSIGSGDFELIGAQANVRIGSIGSGDANLRGVAGNVHVGSVGSGDLGARDIKGDLVVETVGSGSVKHAGVFGQLTLPDKN